MGRPKKERPALPEGITLRELCAALAWFGIDVSFDALRVLVRQLGIPHRAEGRSPKGHGRALYFDYTVLWLLATVYAALYSPKTKAENVKNRLTDLWYELGRDQSRIQRLSRAMREDMEEFFPTGDIDHALMRRVYLAYITNADHGLDPRIITRVADGHWAETGLDDGELAAALLAYKRQALIQMGVDTETANTVGLRPAESSPTSRVGDA